MYCGQTTNKKDHSPHGIKISVAWKKSPNRYRYIIEEEFEEISQNYLNMLEKVYITHYRKTFRDICSYGMNFDEGGKSNGKLSGETLERYSKASLKKWSDPE